MPPPAHISARWTGVFGVGNTVSDIWSMGLNLAQGEGPFFGSDLAPFTQVMADAWVAQIRQHVATFARLTKVKAAFVGPEGLVLREGSGAFIQHERNVSSQGGNPSTAASGINQVSLAVSTQSDTPGPTGRGRFYLPAPGVGPDAGTGLLEDTAAQAVADSCAVFIDTLNAAGFSSPIGDVVIASGGSTSKNLAPGLRRVTRVRVGRRLDVIRSRANAIPELYKGAPVAP
jgi:hypothetical protein